MRVALSKTDKVNHWTNHPRPLQVDQQERINDQRLLRNYLERFLADELEAKGLNYTTSHYLNGSESDPIQKLFEENILEHTYREGNENFLVDFFKDDQIRSRLTEEYYPDYDQLKLHMNSVERVEKRRKIQNQLDKNEREELRKQLFNMYFKMKEIVRNLNDSNPEDPSLFQEEKKLEIVEAMRKYLLPRVNRRNAPKEDSTYASNKGTAVRDYMMVRSDELKEEIYEDIFFEENLNKHQNDEIMKKLVEKLEPKNYEKFKQIGGNKTKELMRLLITRQLMMKEERDRVILRRLQQKKLEEKEEEELRRIMNNYQKKEDKSRKRISITPRMPDVSNYHRDNLSAVLSQAVNSVYDQTSFMGGGMKDRRAFTTGSSKTNLDTARSTQPKKKVESIKRFNHTVPDKKIEEGSIPVVRIKEEAQVFKIPTRDTDSARGSSRGRFKRKSAVDNRNDLQRQHEKTMKQAMSIQSVLKSSPREAVAI